MAVTLGEPVVVSPDLDLATAVALLFREAHCLDNRLWDEWLNLYEEDAIYWMPSWRDFETPTSDPAAELSLIYYAGRRRLEERIWRLRSGQSPASVPFARTLHSISNIRFSQEEPDAIESNVVVHVFQPRRRETQINFSACRHHLRHGPEGWRIAAKKILLLNDYLPASIDVHTV